MMNISMDLSGKLDNPVFLEVLSCISKFTSELDVQFFVVGASARDLILIYGFGIRPGRATHDLDIGVNAASWDEYNRLKNRMIESGLFTTSASEERLNFTGTYGNIPVDVLPFGEVVDPAKKFVWPSEKDTEFNVLGFDEAFEYAIVVRISSDPALDIKVTSAPGLVLLKILAWSERKPVTKDAIDLGILIRSYLQLGNTERLFGKHADLVDNLDFDFELAGAHLLGRDLGEMCGDKMRQKILAILGEELDGEGDLPLIVHSAGANPQIEKTIEFWEAIRFELSIWKGTDTDN